MSNEPTNQPLPAFWTTAPYKGGLLQGIGVGGLISGIVSQARIFSADWLGAAAITVGLVLIVAGGILARSRS